MLQDRHLVPIRPLLFNGFPCPKCGAQGPEARDTVWPGIHVLGNYHCGRCGLEFVRDLPVGFAVDHPMAIAAETGTLYNPTMGEAWIHVPLVRAFHDRDEGPVRIERVVNKENKRVIILNTLDFLYGHVLLKLFNAPHYLQAYPDMGLVLVVPRMYAWLIPDGVAEAWIVDLKLGDMGGWHKAIDHFIQERLAEYEEVQLARGYAHPNLVGIDMAQFTGIRPFDPDTFTTAPPHVTFVVRQDRLWYRNGMSKFLHRALMKAGLGGFLGRSFISDQERLVAKSMRLLRRAKPDITFTIVGLGRPGGHAKAVEDLRTMRMDVTVERAWCKAYARSQVVVGVHGSNMLLPTAMAAGCVEILPYDRYGNLVQDISVGHADRLQLFLYRFVDEFATPKAIVRHVSSMFRDFGDFRRGMKINTF